MALDFPARYPEYLVAAMVIILAPGPSVLFIIARAIAWGRATAVATAAGNVTGAFTLSLMVAFGLGPILQRSEIAFIGVQVLGGFYLIYLGIDAIDIPKFMLKIWSIKVKLSHRLFVPLAMASGLVR